MSIWQQHSIESRIRAILASVPHDGHHFGHPFLSAYQIAIAFRQHHPREAEVIAKPVGGGDTGRHDSLAQYFAHQLSRRIRDGELSGIEGRYLNGQFLDRLQYDNHGQLVVSSLGQANMAIFRLGPP